MAKQFLFFNVQCAACYGSETWRLERIIRTLNELAAHGAPVNLPSSSESDVEIVAEQFIAHHKQIVCPGCGRKGMLAVKRIVQQ